MMSEFKEFLNGILNPIFGKEMTNLLLTDHAINEFFIPAFTHRTFLIEKASDLKNMDYEIYEKLGDKILGASFQLWISSIFYPEISTPQFYADLGKRFEATEFLSYLCDQLEFSKWIKVADNINIDNDIKEDVFEAFIGALSLYANKFIQDGMGLVLGQKWVFAVYNTYARDKIDPTNPSSYVDFRSQVNDVWLFNKWGSAIYITTGEPKAGKVQGLTKGFATVDLKAPNIPSFPAAYRGKIIGSGIASNLDDAREKAAENALKLLKINFSDLKDSEVQYERLPTARLKLLFETRPDVLRQFMQIFDKNKKYETAQFRIAKVSGIFVAQLRIQMNGIWRIANIGRADDKTDALVKATMTFIQSTKRQKK